MSMHYIDNPVIRCSTSFLLSWRCGEIEHLLPVSSTVDRWGLQPLLSL